MTGRRDSQHSPAGSVRDYPQTINKEVIIEG